MYSNSSGLGFAVSMFTTVCVSIRDEKRKNNNDEMITWVETARAQRGVSGLCGDVVGWLQFLLLLQRCFGRTRVRVY